MAGDSAAVAPSPPILPSALRIRRRNAASDPGFPIPKRAVRVFVHEGKPKGVRVNEDTIAVDYGISAVLFDRANGYPVRRFSVEDGWPQVRDPAFGPIQEPEEAVTGPGVWVDRRRNPMRVNPVVARTIEFDGELWRATQPREVEDSHSSTTWSSVLEKASRLSYLELCTQDGRPKRRYTIRDGLPGNMVSHMAVVDGDLFVVAVDIANQGGQWGQGGLARFNAKRDRFEPVLVDGKPVRWVTLLQTVGDDLWVGFREGSGVVGDTIYTGHGIRADEYRPKTTGIVLARRSGGVWSTFTRAPTADRNQAFPTEKPHGLAFSKGYALLFSRTVLDPGWALRPKVSGVLSALELGTGVWHVYTPDDDLGTHRIHGMMSEAGEVLATSDRGVHRWSAATRRWTFLDPGTTLRNSHLSAAAVVGDELWIGYNRIAWGVNGDQGISRFDERTGVWSHWLPESLGTACPVRRIVPLPSGDVWVLFGPREHASAQTIEVPLFEQDAKAWSCGGLGRFSKGKWQYPVVPGPLAQESLGDNRGKIIDLKAVGERLFVGTYGGVLMGPETFEPVFRGTDFLQFLDDAEDGTLAIVATKKDACLRVQRDSTTGAETSRPLDRDSGLCHVGDSPLLSRGSQAWIELPTQTSGSWELGPLHRNAPFDRSGGLTVIATDRAWWVASWGQLLRIDRAALSGLID